MDARPSPCLPFHRLRASPPDESKDPLSLAPHAFASRSSAMPFPPLASGASGAFWSWSSRNARLDHRCRGCLRRFLLVRHHRRELSSSKKNAYHFDKVLTSEPLSKPSTGCSRQRLCRKIDSHFIAAALTQPSTIPKGRQTGRLSTYFHTGVLL